MGEASNRWYFRPRGIAGGIALLLWGGVVLWAGITEINPYMLVFSGLLLLTGGGLIAAFALSRNFGPKLDAFRQICAETVKREALGFFGLEGEADVFAEGYFLHNMPGLLPTAVYGRDGVPRTDIGAALVCFVRNGRIYMYLKQFSLTSKDTHEQSLVLKQSGIASIVGEPVEIPCRTPKGRTVKVAAERLVITSADGEELEARLSGGAIAAAERLRALIAPEYGGG